MRFSESEDEPFNLIPCSHSGWSELQAEISYLLRDGRVTAEDISHLLWRFLDLMAGDSGKRAGETCLGNRSTGRIARLAQEYIEDHYRDTIRMEDDPVALYGERCEVVEGVIRQFAAEGRPLPPARVQPMREFA